MHRVFWLHLSMSNFLKSFPLSFVENSIDNILIVGSVCSARRCRIRVCEREPGRLQSVRSEASANKIRRRRSGRHENDARCAPALHSKRATANHVCRFSGKFGFDFWIGSFGFEVLEIVWMNLYSVNNVVRLKI